MVRLPRCSLIRSVRRLRNVHLLWLGLLAILPMRAADAPAPVPVREAIRSITLPRGFKVSLFAGEPDVVQPIAMTTDTRGRLWVVECLSYPHWSTNRVGRDRVSIYEDTDGDGQFEIRKVFWDKGCNLTGIALGFGGVWLCSLPELIFIPDRDGDDKPDGAPQVVLDGWDLASKHNAFNGLTWGPDGWLYGCNGILGNALVGAPGAPKEKRVPMNCGVWRLHPTRRTFEVVAHGTTNPWGIAFDENGQMFVANCVIKHLFHIIPGAHYERMFGQDFSPYLFELIPSIADHIHWAGGYWKTEGADSPQNDLAGGGHAHCGAMIYLGDEWPQEYRNTFFTINIHGHRVNNDLLEPQGSGYAARHRRDFMRVNDTWFRGVSIVPAGDGGVFVSDWCDAGECHDYEDIHPENGRVFKVVYGERKRQLQEDFRRLADADLIESLASRDEWKVQQARLVLQERAFLNNLKPGTAVRLREMFKWGESLHNRLRALWALHAVGESRSVFEDALVDREEQIRAWAIRLITDESLGPRFSFEFSDMAANDPSPVVRLSLASALQKIPRADAGRIAAGLVKHGEDAEDHNLPLMIWYGIEPIVGADENTALKLLTDSQIPLLRQFIARRLSLASRIDGLAALLNKTEDSAAQADVIAGMFEALNGRRGLAAPEQWSAAAQRLAKHPSAEIRERALRLSVIFGDDSAFRDLEKRVTDKTSPLPQRVAALDALASTRRSGLAPLFQQAVQDAELQQSAIRALAACDDPKTPAVILSEYPRLGPLSRAEAVATLSSRAPYAAELLQAIREGKVPRRDLTPFAVRQIEAFKDPKLTAMLGEVGTVRPVSGEKAAQIAHLKSILTPAALGQGDLKKGRELFRRTCAGCHTLFDEGGKLAPELTGSQRANLDYLLENIVDPNAVVWDQYKANYFETTDDRLISGIIVGENESTVTVQTQTGTIILPRGDIARRTPSNLSMMPEGLLDSLSEQEIIDLIAYLQSPRQAGSTH